MDLPILSYPPPSRLSRCTLALRTTANIASERIGSFNSWVAEQIKPVFKTTSRRVLQFELAVLAGFGFTFMQIGEWILAIGCWVLIGSILFVKAVAWDGFKAAPISQGFQRFLAVLAALIVMVFLIAITSLRKPDIEPWTNLQKLWQPKSVLLFNAYMVGSYGPTKQITSVDIDISNRPEEAIQNLDLIIKMVSPRRIISISQQPTDAGHCELSGVPLPDSRVVIDGQAGDHLTLDSQDAFMEMNYFFRWHIRCQRISGQGTIRIQLTTTGDAEKDSIQVVGTYERIPSKGSVLVKVKGTIPVGKS